MTRTRSQITIDRRDSSQVSNRPITQGASTEKTNRSASKATNSAQGCKTASQASTIVNGKRNMSDISADEADEPQSAKHRHVSSVHTHAEKISPFEYRCGLCAKVR